MAVRLLGNPNTTVQENRRERASERDTPEIYIKPTPTNQIKSRDQKQKNTNTEQRDNKQEEPFTR